MARKIKVCLAHLGLWEMEKLSMPLAHGYLKAMALADDDIRREVDIQIATFGGGHQLAHIIPEIVIKGAPDVLGLSVFGWNYNKCARIAETFRQANPRGLCIFGGTHVAYQAERVFRMAPEVDVIVNGEGERTFVNLLRAHILGRSPRDLGDIKGISFKAEDGRIVTTPDEERIKNLDEIPSPFLTGALPLTGPNGDFLYDVAMMETNRGCPYSCAFCYWGGAVGQKVWRFSRDRLRAELDLFGYHKVENIALCDANFGMLPSDRELLDDLLATRARHGYPRNMVNSWAKNKGKIFFDIVEAMHKANLSGDFTLALQTLSPEALETSRRHNMKLNRFEDLCEWLNARGLPSYVELIWGLPGETVSSFFEGYDKVARYTPRIATYTNMLLPNTEYDQRRAEYEFVTMRGEEYDFEYVLSHRTMSFDDNVKIHGFMFWSRILAEHQHLRHIWIPLRVLAKISQSTAILSLDTFLEGRPEPSAAGLLACKREVVDNLDASRIGRALRYLYRDPGVRPLLEAWWEGVILPRIEPPLQGFFRELFAYDCATQPVSSDMARAAGLPVEELFGAAYFVRRGLSFHYDFEGLLRHVKRESADDPAAVVERFRAEGQVEVTLLLKCGYELVIDNHETVLQYIGKRREEIEAEAELRAAGVVAETTQMHVVGLPDRSLARSLPVVGG